MVCIGRPLWKHLDAKVSKTGREVLLGEGDLQQHVYTPQVALCLGGIAM